MLITIEVIILKGRTFGKALLGLNIFDKNGNKITIIKCLLKELYILLWFFYLLNYYMGIIIFLLHFVPTRKSKTDNYHRVSIDYIFKFRIQRLENNK